MPKTKTKHHEGDRPEGPRFAHESERRIAALFDFYEIAWEYEPVEFALSFDDSGRVSSAIRPDFYLPDYNLFIELTTLRQELVTKKNRKVRQLRALYPELNIKVLYRADYAHLLDKARLDALVRAGQQAPVPTSMKPSQRSA